MNEELNKELCGLLGICWHERIKGDWSDEYKFHCSCGVSFWGEEGLERHVKAINPDFTSDSGKIALLREMYTKLEKRVFDKFMVRMANPENFMLFLFDNTDKLAIEARDFLKGQKV